MFEEVSNMSTLIDHQIRPTGAWFTVNRACNFRCLGCYAKGTGYSSSKDMSLELAEKLLTLLASLEIRNVIVIGGEPTLWKDLFRFNELCSRQKVKTTLVTNAMKFGVDAFWEQYQISPNTKVGISVKAFDEESLRQVAEVNSFETTKKGIERGVRLFKCGVSTFYNAVSSDKLIDIAQFAMDCGARSLSISPCSPAFCDGKSDSTYVLHPSVVVQNFLGMYPRLDEITKGKLRFSLKLALCIWPKNFIEMLVKKNQINTVCQMHKRIGLIFDVDGKLAICNSLFDYAIGKFGEDFSDKESLLNLLNSPQVIGLYNKLTSYPSTKCVGCEKYDVCAGGCPLFWSLYNPQELIPGWN
jgi:radical SAM protein with 4Fe4S-binding SPASM domain